MFYGENDNTRLQTAMQATSLGLKVASAVSGGGGIAVGAGASAGGAGAVSGILSLT